MVGFVSIASVALVAVGSAEATWLPSSATLIDFRDVCRDGIRFGAAVRGSDPATEPYKNRAVAVQPPPPSWSEWKDREGEVMDSPITVPIKQGTVVTPDEEKPIPVSHQGEFTQRYQRAPLPLGPLALNLEGGNPDSNLNTDVVTDCFLFAPIDVEPGKADNKVPVGRGQVWVAALATDLLPTDNLAPSDFRFGPGKAHATRSQRRDVNGDERRDLVLRFSSKAAGLKCSTRTALLKGQVPGGGTYEGTDKIVPTRC
jgi:hypothetical protein